MRMKFIDITDCREGSILAERVYNRQGALIVVENTSLNKYIINRLSQLGVQQVAVYDDYMEDNCLIDNSSYQHVKENYKESISKLKSIITGLSSGKPLDVGAVNSVTDAIYEDIHESSYLIRVLNEEKQFDEYTYTHSINVAFYSMLMAKWLGLGEADIKNAVKSGLLHDIGKTKIPIEILNKKAKLSDEEFNHIKRHTIMGFDMLKPVDYISPEICEAVLLHHEREDKSGYPFGLGDKQINIYAKIIAIADVYDAMTSDRVYKKRSTPFDVFEMFKTIGVKNFDPEILNKFLMNISALYIDTEVKLKKGEIGKIVYIPPQNITEPIIKIGQSYIDLSRDSDNVIISMV